MAIMKSMNSRMVLLTLVLAVGVLGGKWKASDTTLQNAQAHPPASALASAEKADDATPQPAEAANLAGAGGSESRTRCRPACDSRLSGWPGCRCRSEKQMMGSGVIVC